jgi:hypothetical protein
METPKYCPVGTRPVMALMEKDGFGVYAFNWETGKFDLDLSYIERIYFGSMDHVEEVTQEAFDAYVEKIRKARGFSDQ